MASKAQDTKNYRKGAKLAVGDMIYMREKVNGELVGYELRAIASKTKEPFGNNYRLFDVTGQWTKCVSPHEYAHGQF